MDKNLACLKTRIDTLKELKGSHSP